MQEAIDALSDLEITRHLAENNTVRCREPSCPPPRGSLMADHLEVKFDQFWSHEQTVAGVKSHVRGTIPDMLYSAQAELHSVRFPLGNPSTQQTVLASHPENESSDVSSKSPAESYQASQFAVLLGNCQALNAAANYGRHQRRMPATDVYELHAVHANVGGAAHSQHTLAEARQEAELQRASNATTAQTSLLTDQLLSNKSEFFSQMKRLNTVQHLQTQCMTSGNHEDYAEVIQATNSMWKEGGKFFASENINSDGTGDTVTGLPASSFVIDAVSTFQHEAASAGQTAEETVVADPASSTTPKPRASVSSGKSGKEVVGVDVAKGDANRTCATDVRRFQKRIPLMNRLSALGRSDKDLQTAAPISSTLSKLQLKADQARKRREANAATTQSQSKRKAEVTGGTTDNNATYAKKAKSAMRIPKTPPFLTNAISRAVSPHYIDEGEYEGPMFYDPEKWPLPSSEIIVWFTTHINQLKKGVSYRREIWKMRLSLFMNPCRCRWHEIPDSGAKASSMPAGKHFPYNRTVLPPLAAKLSFSEITHTLPRFELLKACYTGRKRKQEFGLTSIPPTATYLAAKAVTSNPALSNSPAVKQKEKKPDALMQMLSDESSSAPKPSGAASSNSNVERLGTSPPLWQGLKMV